MKVLELFSGTECISNAFRARGHECFTVDWNEKFPSSWHADISKITAQDIIERFGKPDICWVGTDCTSYSVAAISKHRRRNPETGNLDPISDYARFCDEMNQHVLKLLKELEVKLYFIVKFRRFQPYILRKYQQCARKELADTCFSYLHL